MKTFAKTDLQRKPRQVMRAMQQDGVVAVTEYGDVEAYLVRADHYTSGAVAAIEAAHKARRELDQRADDYDERSMEIDAELRHMSRR